MAKKTEKNEVLIDPLDPKVKQSKNFIQGTSFVNLLNAYTKEVELFYEHGFLGDKKLNSDIKFGSLRHKTVKDKRGIAFDYNGLYEKKDKILPLWKKITDILEDYVYWEEIEERYIEIKPKSRFSKSRRQ